MAYPMEKFEECPKCESVKKWLYDAQICANCGYERIKSEFTIKDGHDLRKRNRSK